MIEVPSAFWRELSHLDFLRIVDRGLLNYAQCRRVWELSGLSPDDAPDGLRVVFDKTEIVRWLSKKSRR